MNRPVTFKDLDDYAALCLYYDLRDREKGVDPVDIEQAFKALKALIGEVHRLHDLGEDKNAFDAAMLTFDALRYRGKSDEEAMGEALRAALGKGFHS